MTPTHPRPNRTHYDHPSQGGGDPSWCIHIRHDEGERVTVRVQCGVHDLTRTARWERTPAMAHSLRLTLHRMADRDRHRRPRVSEQLGRIALNIEDLVKAAMVSK